MKEVFLRLLECNPAPDRSWRAELWLGHPAAAGSTRLAGEGTEFTGKDLMRDAQYKTTPQALDLATISERMHDDEADPVFFPALGLRLFEVLQKAGVAQKWRALRGAEAVRTYLEVPGSLAAWPWELLAWEVPPGLVQHTFHSSAHPVMRAAESFDSTLKWVDTLVRILLISGQEILDPANKASDELRVIRRIFHESGLSVLVELCEAPPNPQEVEARIADFKPHVVHFIGHGELEGIGAEADFSLRFKSPPEPERAWTASRIFQFFSDTPWKPRLVVLNACHSSRYEENTAAVADARLAAGIPAVIGAQASPRIDDARHFSEVFYQVLAGPDLPPLDQAMAKARMALSNKPESKGAQRRHWSLPVLRVQAPVEQILQFRRASTEVAACFVTDVFSRPGRFVNRSKDRWTLVSQLAPALPGGLARRGIILEGGQGQGKSWLVKRAARDFVDAGFLVRYAEMSKMESRRTSLDVLQDWRGRNNEDAILLKPFPAEHFEEFDAGLKEAGTQPSARATWEAFAAFKAGLQSVRCGRRVLLILERFRRKGCATVAREDFREGLLQQLLLPIQAGDPAVEGVFALLVVRAHSDVSAGQIRDFDEYGLGLLTSFCCHSISNVTLKDLDNLLDEFTNFVSNAPLQSLRQAFQAYLVPKGMSPHDLERTTWSLQKLEDIDRPVVLFQKT